MFKLATHKNPSTLIRSRTITPSGVRKKQKGFSLVELLVVVAILAILAAIAIPLFLNQRSKAVQGAVQSDARNFATDVTNLFSGLSPGAVPPPSLTATSLTVDGETMNFATSPNVSFVDTTAPVSLNGSGVKISSSDDPTYACVISMPFTVQQGWENGFQPQCGTIVSEQGNLLTANQASFEDGVSAMNVGGGIWSSIVNDGTYSVSGKRSSKGTVSSSYTGGANLRVAPSIGGAVAVTPGQTYTASAMVRGSHSDQWRMRLYFYNGSTLLSNADGASLALPTDGFSLYQATGVAPVNATKAEVFLSGSNVTSGAEVWVDQVGLWQGSGGSWSLPGVPIVKE